MGGARERVAGWEVRLVCVGAVVVDWEGSEWLAWVGRWLWYVRRDGMVTWSGVTE